MKKREQSPSHYSYVSIHFNVIFERSSCNRLLHSKALFILLQSTFSYFFNTIAIPIRLRIFVSYFPSSVTEDTGKETTKMLTEHGDAKREKKGPILNCKKI